MVKIQSLGFSVGIQQNFGTKDNYITFYGRGEDVAELLRVSPRIQVSIGKTKIAGEIEYTLARFGSLNKNDKG